MTLSERFDQMEAIRAVKPADLPSGEVKSTRAAKSAAKFNSMHAARELQTQSPPCARRNRRWCLRDSSRHSSSALREECGEEASRQAEAGTRSQGGCRPVEPSRRQLEAEEQPTGGALGAVPGAVLDAPVAVETTTLTRALVVAGDAERDGVGAGTPRHQPSRRRTRIWMKASTNTGSRLERAPTPRCCLSTGDWTATGAKPTIRRTAMRRRVTRWRIPRRQKLLSRHPWPALTQTSDRCRAQLPAGLPSCCWLKMTRFASKSYTKCICSCDVVRTKNAVLSHVFWASLLGCWV